MAVAEERKRRRRDRGAAAALVEHRELQRHAPHRGRLADPLEEAQVLGEAAERDMLAVVGLRVQVGIAPRKRLYSAAQPRPRLVERHLVPGVHELERRTQARKTA